MYVYFIRQGKSGPIKIGKAINVERRLSELQTANPYQLSIITKIVCESERGALKMEKQLHRKFKKHRLFGEWFSGNIKLSDVIELCDDEEVNRKREPPHVTACGKRFWKKRSAEKHEIRCRCNFK